MRIIGAASTGNQVLGNLIGTDVAGTADLGNLQDGVVIWDAPGNTIGSAQPGEGNVISGNATYGVRIVFEGASGNQVLGNLIGTDAAGATGLGNDQDGVVIWDAPDNTIGGGQPEEGNVISGNATYGVRISAPRQPATRFMAITSARICPARRT